ncbi:hypothetical protein ACFSS8_23835 [Paracoccus kondratievae]
MRHDDAGRPGIRAGLAAASDHHGGAVLGRGPTDTVARMVAERMSADLGQQIIIENIGGAGAPWGPAMSPRPMLMAIRCFCITSAWPPRPRYTATLPMTR